MKKLLYITILFISIFLISCSIESIYINENIKTMDLNGTYVFKTELNGEIVSYESSNTDIIEFNNEKCFAKNVGICYIYVVNESGKIIQKNLVEVVSEKPTSFKIVSPKKILDIGDEVTLEIEVTPVNADSSAIYESSDDTVITVTKEGNIKAIKEGVATITATSKRYPDVLCEMTFFVNEDINAEHIMNKEEITKVEVDSSNMSMLFLPIIEKAQQSIVGISTYKKIYNMQTIGENGSGIIYKKEQLNDGTYEYYVISNKHVVNNTSSIDIHTKKEIVKGNIIACDSKVDLAVLYFLSNEEYELATFGNSDNLKPGEIILSMGYSSDGDYITTTMGVISHDERYVSTDTDGDGVSDWDSAYIQHDASISDGFSGGPLIDLNGNIIGINSEKIIQTGVENMAFSIPINIVLDLASQLEQGIIPQRPVLGISAMYVKDIINSDYYSSIYYIPEWLDYGAYITELVDGSVASIGGLLIGDILLTFDNEKITYSYLLRAKLGECVIGSNQEVEITVLRNNEIITLKVVF